MTDKQIIIDGVDMTDKFVEVDENEDEYWDNEVAICPYCGFKNRPEESDGYLYNQNTDTYTCEHCGKEFEVEVSISFDWTTSKINKESNNDR